LEVNVAFTRSRETDAFETRAIRAGQDPCAATGATIPPIYQTATFTQDAVGVDRGFDYSRTGNPTRLALERQLAALEGGRFAACFGSGAAAVAAACSVLRPGEHIVATEDCYGGTYRYFVDVLAGFGIDTTFVDTTSPTAISAALTCRTRLLWIESPTNPLLRVADLSQIGLRKPSSAVLVVDNTFCTPYFQQPLELGADMVVHSTTKYINGHSDVVGGAVVTNAPRLSERIAFHQNAVGAVPGPMDAYLTLRGAKTLAVRMRRHEENATHVARWLQERRDVADVIYPGLPSHRHHALASRQQRGFGGIVSFRVHGGRERALAVARSTRLFNLAVSLGGVESLICCPAEMTHKSMPDAHKRRLGITPDLLRLSVGLEAAEDLVNDLSEALNQTRVAVST
jgi:cystathionine beta-lyase/cystathionine gamma-synthase